MEQKKTVNPMKSSPLSLWAIYAMHLVSSRSRQTDAQRGAVPHDAQSDVTPVELTSDLWERPVSQLKTLRPIILGGSNE